MGGDDQVVAGNRKHAFVLLVSVLTVLAISIPVYAAWPSQAEWIPALGANWGPITDPLDQQQSFLDCITDKTATVQAAAYWFYDGTYFYFRMILDGDPLKAKGSTKELQPFGWAAMIESTGNSFPDYVIGIDGTGTANRIHTMYNLTPDMAMDGETGYAQSATTSYLDADGFWYVIRNAAGTNYVRSKQVTTVSSYWWNGTPDYYLDFRVPMTWLSRAGGVTPPAPITANTPIKIAFGTDASGQNIGKDLVGYSGTIDVPSYFDSVPPVTPGGGYGILVDGKHSDAGMNLGVWYRGEVLKVYGSGWPASTQNPPFTGYLQVRIVYPDGTTHYQVPAPGIVTTTTGVVNLQSAWTIGPTAPEGVYSIYVAHPYSGVYMLKDTFTVSAVVIDLSTSTKTADRSEAVAADQITYTITIRNTGSSPVNNLVVVDNIPFHTVYVPNSTRLNGSSVADVSGKTPLEGGITIPLIGANSSATVTFAVKVDVAAPDGASITNTASISWGSITRYLTASTVVRAPLMQLMKSVSPLGSVDPGTVLTYTVTFRNAGHSDARQVEIIDDMPPDTLYVPGSLTLTDLDGTFTFQHVAGGPYDSSEMMPVTSIKYYLETLQPGADHTYTFQVVVK